MELKLTKQQYWHLLRATYMADWMANAICDADMEEDDDIKNIRNYIFSFAKEMGYGDFVDYAEDLKQYFASIDMDDEPSTRALIERYDEHNLWENLPSWLGERDFFRKYTKKERQAMSQKERFMKLMECEEKWEEEFEKHGVERLEIKKEIKN